LLSISRKHTERKFQQKSKLFFLQVHVESISKDLMNKKKTVFVSNFKKEAFSAYFAGSCDRNMH
jgi:hypothetical protein